MPAIAEATETVRITRQPILSAGGEVFGYHLTHAAPGGNGVPGAARALTDSVLSVGLEQLTDGRPAFMNVTRELLLSDACRVLPPAAAVFEIESAIAVDEDVMKVCRDLQSSGYALALHGFTPKSEAEQLLPFVRFVKVDAVETPTAQKTSVARHLAHRGLRLIAEQVGTRELARDAQTAGFDLFQGFFFCEPLVLRARPLPGRQLAYLNLLAALNRPTLSMSELEDLIKRDGSLTIRVLQCVNSAAFGVRREISSLREALVLLGTGTISRWATIWALAALNTGPTEVVTMAVLRGRCCELMGDRLSEGTGADLFLLGLCSLLETMLNVPMARALEEMPLSAETRMALLGAPGAERSLLDGVIAYERGDWANSEQITGGLGLPPDAAARAYRDALRWAASLSSTTR